jgi:HTH-type transcriptional regulator/antitoxin HipB
MNEFPIWIPQQFGMVLRGFRCEKKLTQQAVGVRAGLAQNAISQIETKSGPVSLDRVFRILSALDVELVLRHRKAPNPRSDW